MSSDSVTRTAGRVLAEVKQWRLRKASAPTTSTPVPMSPDIQGEGVMVIVTLIVAFTLMAGEWAPPEIVFTVVNSLFHTAGIVTDAQASSGYGNTGLLTVIFLYMVAEGIYQTGVLEGMMMYVLGRSRSPFWAIVRVCIPVMFISAFLNNTPIVSLFTPILVAWARRSGVPVKKVLIPLSFAATLGGTCTTIGTSTNLVIVGQQTARYNRLKRFEDSQMNMFDIAPYGVPYAIWGFLFIALTQKWLLPGNSSRFAKDLLFALRVKRESPLHGKKFIDTSLSSMHGVNVVGYSRNGSYVDRTPTYDYVFTDGDVLYVVGEVSDVEFYAEDFGLEWLNHETEELADGAEKNLKNEASSGKYDKLIQVTVLPGAEFVNSNLGSVDFNAMFNVVVVAFKRGSGEKVASHLSDIVLEGGDILVVNADDEADITGAKFRSYFTHIHMLGEGAEKEFITSFVVMPGSPLVGKTIAEAGLRGMPGLSAFALDSADKEDEMDVIPNDHKLQAGETIWISTDINGYCFVRKMKGILMSVQAKIDKTAIDIVHRELLQGVVSPKSFLLGKSLRDVNFREKFHCTVVAIARSGRSHRLPIGTTPIQTGDVLLMDVHSDFYAKHKADKAFALLMRVENSSPPKKSRGWIALLFGFGMVMTQIIHGLMSDNKDYMAEVRLKLFRGEMIHLWPASVLTTCLMLVFKCLNFKQATDSILWDVYLTIAAAFGVSVATEATGVARAIANIFISIARSAGGEGAALTAIYVATAVLSEILTNNAAGAVMFPIAAEVGDVLNIAPKNVSIAIMLGASAGFINPYSYQCNLMVYSAGNYTFKEFAIIGAPFQIYLAIVAAAILFNLGNWSQIWIVSFVVTAAVIGTAAVWNLLPKRFTLSAELWFEDNIEKPLAPILSNYIARPVVTVISLLLLPLRLVRGAIMAVVNPAASWKERFLKREKKAETIKHASTSTTLLQLGSQK